MGPGPRPYIARCCALIAAVVALLVWAAPAWAVSAPTMGTGFNPTVVALNATTSLTFTISNPNPGTSLTGVAFSDTLPVGLTVPNASATVCGGTVTLTSPRTIGITGATIAANNQCIFSVTVTGATAGNYTNTTGAVSSTNGGTGNTSSASLTVDSPPSLAQAFGAPTVPLNGTTSLTLTITNPNSASALSGIAFTDTLPSGLAVASSPHVSNACGGTATATAGAGTVSLSGGALAAGAQCVVEVDIAGTTSGVKTNSVQGTSTEGGTGNTANASITVVAPPVIIKVFGAAAIPLNGTTSLTFTIQNNNTSTTLTGIAFTDSLPAGLVVASPNGLSVTCAGGSISADPGAGVVGLSGATLGASSSCTVTINVTGTTAGAKTNTTGAVTSTEGGTGGTATAFLHVDAPPSLAVSFNPTTIGLNDTTSLTFTTTNPSANPDALTGVAFTDTLPAGLTVPSASATVCGGTVTLTPPRTITITGATISAGSQCQFSVTVTGASVGNYSNTTGAVSSTNGGTGNSASAQVFVGSAKIQQSFGAASIPLGSATTMTFTVQNPNSSLTLTGLHFTDSLPAGLVVSPTPGVVGSCGGGTITAAAGATAVSLSGATLAPSATCTFSVNVTGTAGGTKVNSTSGVASNEAPVGAPASASLDVVAPPQLSIQFAPTSIPAGKTAQLSVAVSNPSANAVALTTIAVSDTLPAGVVISTPNGLTGSCGAGTIAAPAGGSTLSLAGASLPVSGSCTFSVSVTGATTGVKTDTTNAATSANGGTGSPATAILTVLGQPTVTITAPADKKTYVAGRSVVAHYSCADDPNGPGISSCAGPVASDARINTKKAGKFSFTVKATAKDGRTASRTVTYTVSAPKPPTSRIIGLHGTVLANSLSAFHGTATAGASRLASVAISLARIANGAVVATAKRTPQCWALSARGTLTQVKLKGKVCRARTFLRAAGTAKWTFQLKHRLPPGTYVLTSRATDSNRVVESVFSAKRGNRVQFTVR